MIRNRKLHKRSRYSTVRVWACALFAIATNYYGKYSLSNEAPPCFLHALSSCSIALSSTTMKRVLLLFLEVGALSPASRISWSTSGLILSSVYWRTLRLFLVKKVVCENISYLLS